MATIRTASGETLSTADDVRGLLAELGIEYATWGVDRLGELADPGTLADDAKRAILEAYAPELSELVARRGYLTSDVVTLSPATPGLDGMLATFRREHYHTDDEVRFGVAGRGSFFFRDRAGAPIECEVHAGDLIVVPAYTWHWFELCDERRMACVRVFKTPAGWVASFKDEQAPPAPSPAAS